MLKSKILRRDTIIGVVLFAGVGVALLSAFESRVSWIATFCGMLGDGCRDTARYRLLGLPVAPWGMIYYALLGLLYLRHRPWLFWGVMAGAGFEGVLVGIMVKNGFFCVFCAVNFLLVAILWLCLFDRRRFWEMAAVILFSYVLGGFLISDARPPKQARPESAESVLARVGDREITVADVERPLTSELHKLRQRIHEMKNAVLETRINDLLLEQEARGKGVDFEALVAEIRGQIAPPATHVVDHYYDAGLYRKWGAWEGSEQEIKARIREYLHNRESDPLLLEHCRRLREKYPVDVFLKPPPLPLTQVRIDGAYTLGPSDALVTVVELSDYLCPACRKGHGVVRQIKEKYQGKIRWVFKDYPLDSHPGARELALAARCAGIQGKFWAYQDRLFSGDKKPTPQEAVAYAEELGLNPVRFRQCMADLGLAKDLEASISDVRDAGIGSTPTFIINGRMQIGTPSFDEFSEMIDQALKEAEGGARKAPASAENPVPENMRNP